MSVLDELGVKENLRIAANELIKLHQGSSEEIIIFDITDDGNEALRSVVENEEIMKFLNSLLEEDGLICGYNATNKIEICVMSVEVFEKHIHNIKITTAEFEKLADQYGLEEAEKILIERQKAGLLN